MDVTISTHWSVTYDNTLLYIGVARGALGSRAAQGREKNVGPNVLGRVVSATPGRGRVQIFRRVLLGREIWRVGVVNFAVLACIFRLMTKKGSRLFREKMHPKRKSWLRLCCYGLFN